jgi:uncharacterized repeat protein (TIGR01451 family)
VDVAGRHRSPRAFIAILAALSLATGSAPQGSRAADPIASGDGLLGKYYANRDWAGDPYQTRVDPLIDFDFTFRVAPEISVDWSGSLLIESAGSFTFGLHSDDGSVLSLDGAVVVDNGGEHGPRLVANTIELSAGLHPISIRYFQCCGDPAFIRFLWTPPGGADLVVVPQAVLFSGSTVPANVELTKLADDRAVDAGEAVSFTITVTNTGDGTATDVVMTDRFPTDAGLQWDFEGTTGVAPDECLMVNGVDFTCSIATLGAGEFVAAHFRSPTGRETCGTVDNTAYFTTSNAGSGQAADSVVVSCLLSLEAVTGRELVIRPNTQGACLSGGALLVRRMATTGMVLGGWVELAPLEPVDCFRLRLPITTLVPGAYSFLLTARDADGVDRDSEGSLMVLPTSRVVILVQGLASHSMASEVDGRSFDDCWLGGPSTPFESKEKDRPEVVQRMENLQTLGFGGMNVQLEEYTFYVLDYPAPFLNQSDYCYAASPLQRTMLPRYGPYDTGERGIGPAVGELDRLIESFPAGTTVDVIGHSQGAVIVADWLATEYEDDPDTADDDADKLHAVITLDGPWDGVSTALTEPVSGQQALCLGAEGTFGADLPNIFFDCLLWRSWSEIGVGGSAIVEITPTAVTTERALVATLTCDDWCLGTLGIRTTQPGAWHSIVMDGCQVTTKGSLVGKLDIKNHGCFFSDEESLKVLAWLVASEPIDSGDSQVFPPTSSFVGLGPTTPSALLDDLIRRSGLVSTRTAATMRVFLGEGTYTPLSRLTLYYRATNPGLIRRETCTPDVTAVLDGRDPRKVTGKHADAFDSTETYGIQSPPTPSGQERFLCRYQLPMVLGFGDHVLTIHVNAPGVEMIVDAVSTGPPAP